MLNDGVLNDGVLNDGVLNDGVLNDGAPSAEGLNRHLAKDLWTFG